MSRNLVLVAEDFEHQHQPLIQKLSAIGVESIACANTAVALEVTILKESPSVVVFNSSMLGFETVKKLINNVKFAGAVPIYYNIYSYEDPETLNLLEELGIIINISLPCSFDAIAGHIKVINDNQPLDVEYFKSLIHKQLVNILNELTMTSKQHGRGYIVDAAMYILFKNNIKANFNGEIYPYVAKKYNTNTECVEHSIRSAINKCWKNTPKDLKMKYFPDSYFTLKKPTNSKFILTVSQFVLDENMESFVKLKREKSKKSVRN